MLKISIENRYMLLERIKNFISMSWIEKLIRIKYRTKLFLNMIFPWVPLPVYLPYGMWWFAINDHNSDKIFAGIYESSERIFLEQFLKEGVTFLDVGAHDGFYTLLASKKVGPLGHVIAFEPSPRERKRLLFHVKLNHCNNVKIEPFALSSKDAKANFYVVQGRDTGCNSLLPPRVSEPTKMISVETITLDSYLQKDGIRNVDFIKIDAEGVELEIFKGSKYLLEQVPRPVILCEVEDYRMEPYGYSSRDLFTFTEGYGYQWFGLKKGKVVLLDNAETSNLLAVPKESIYKLNLHSTGKING